MTPPAAVTTHQPILLVGNNSVPADTLAAISSLGLTKLYIVGGTGAVSASVAGQLGVAAGDRIAGANRYATAVAFANRAKAEGWLAFTHVGIAATTADALAGGVTMGLLGGPMLLGASTSLPADTASFLAANKWDIQQIYAFGGTSVVGAAVLTAANAAVQNLSEVKMVPATATPNFPEGWPTDGREGGVPDPATAGPDFIQVGNEAGFLPAPVVIAPQPITWNLDPTTFNFGNVDLHALLLAPAERADVVIDFAQYAGKTLIMYNDAPAAFPALDPRYDYYTDSPDLTETGGYWGTQPGRGPNTRTVMQIKVSATAAAPAYDMAALNAAFATTATHDGVFKVAQDPIIVGQAAYNTAYNANFSAVWPLWGVVQIADNELTFATLDSGNVTARLEPKAIQDEMGEAFDREFGRMSGMLGLERPAGTAGTQNFQLYPYASPPVELLEQGLTGVLIGQAGDNTQIWKITHNGVDTHPIHFHLHDVQVLNRVGWDGAVRMPDENELGWKETVRVSPLEDTSVALRPILPVVPFDVPNSVRPLDVTKAPGAVLFDGNNLIFDPMGEPVGTVNNVLVNFGWEYVVHCHILSHEEMDMMHGVAVGVRPDAPTGLAATAGPTAVGLSWVDNSHNETGFVIERAGDVDFTLGLVTFSTPENATTYDDATAGPGTYYYRVYAANTIGDTTDYTAANPATVGFPWKTVLSSPSDAATVVVP